MPISTERRGRGTIPMAPQSPRLMHWILLGVLAVLWGSAFAGTEVALRSFSPVTIVAGRVLVGALLLICYVRLSARKMPAGARQWRWIVAMAIVGNVVPFYLIAWGQQRVDSNIAGILMAVMPLMVVALAHRFVPGERVDARRVSGMLVGLAGVVMLLGVDGALPWGGNGSLAGRLAILAGAMFYAVNVIMARLAPPMDSSATAAGVTLVAAILIVPVALFTASPAGNVESASILAVILLGALATGLATVIYFEIVRQAGPAFLSLINYLVPAWAVVAGGVLLGESLQATSLVALAIIFAGVLVSQRSECKLRTSAKPQVAAAGTN
ncbi:MAG: DMT family transporter [Gammaproteobacteria bacterium]|nr:DMT family transporter [Gammaproteobacteria bacterium]